MISQRGIELDQLVDGLISYARVANFYYIEKIKANSLSAQNFKEYRKKN